MRVLLETKDLHYKYPNGPEALKGLNIRIEQGAKIALVGPNGAGKSTLLLMLNGMLKPDSGEVLFDGIPLKYESRSLRELRRKVGFVFQNPDVQIIAPTVYQDVAFGPVNLGYNDEEVKSAVSEALGYVGLTGYERRPPHYLSGGEKKRVAIAGVLAMNPDVLVFDEPTSSLDPAGAEQIMELLDELHNSGKTIIISTHDVELVYLWAVTVILMEKGSILKQSTPDKAFSDREMIKKAKLRMPVLLDLYSAMVERGMSKTKKLPKTVLDLIHFIENDRFGGMCCERSGSIFLINADTVTDSGLVDFFKQNEVSSVSALGTGAKALAVENSIHLDFTYGVIDKSILKAMNACNSLIISSGGMIDRVHERVAGFNRDNGKNVSIIMYQNDSEVEVADGNPGCSAKWEGCSDPRLKS